MPIYRTEAELQNFREQLHQDWNRIICQLGTPAAPPKPRGKSPGRQSGQTQTVRPRFSVVKKGKSRTPQTEIAA